MLQKNLEFSGKGRFSNTWIASVGVLIFVAISAIAPVAAQSDKAPTFGFNVFEKDRKPSELSLGGVAYKSEAALSVDVVLADDGSKLTLLGAQQLQRLAGAILVGRTVQKVKLIGHTDSIGEAAENQVRGQRYADTVRASLYYNGIELPLIEAVSAGEKSPIANNLNAAGRSKNRRVEIIVVGLNEPKLAGIINGTELASPTDPEYANDDRVERVTLTTSSLFNAGTAKVNGQGEFALEQIAYKLRNDGWDEVVILGHSAAGTPAPDRMSKMQAAAVLEYLVDHGIDSRNTMSVGLGTTVPAVQEQPTDPRNSRVVIEIHRN